MSAVPILSTRDSRRLALEKRHRGGREMDLVKIQPAIEVDKQGKVQTGGLRFKAQDSGRDEQRRNHKKETSRVLGHACLNLKGLTRATICRPMLRIQSEI